jgi:hypothetical protein
MRSAIGIAEIIEQLGAEREREGKVERMAPAPGVGLGGLVRRQSLIGITHHPEELRAINAFAGERIGVGERHQAPMPLRVVKPLHFIASAARRFEFAEPVMAGGSGATSDDFQPVVAKFCPGL